eukprot:1950766-Rhodomonas_salina.2
MKSASEWPSQASFNTRQRATQCHPNPVTSRHGTTVPGTRPWPRRLKFLVLRQPEALSQPLNSVREPRPARDYHSDAIVTRERSHRDWWPRRARPGTHSISDSQ